VLLGDAAGFSDPITGGGMTQALLSAELLAQHIARRTPAAEDWLTEFDREREKLLRDYRRLTALMLWLAERPVLLGLALETMHRLPRLFSHLLGVAGGARPSWTSLESARSPSHARFSKPPAYHE
jgi:flavin-dependent dehydrogenase